MQGTRISPGPKTSVVGIKRHDMFPTPYWRDFWVAIAFYLHLIIFLGISAHALSKSFTNFDQIKVFLSMGLGMTTFGLIQISIALFTSIGITVLAFLSMYSRAESTIRGAIIGNIVLLVIFGITSFAFGISELRFVMGVIYLVCALLLLLFYFSISNRIPFTAMILKMVMDCIKLYPSTIIVSAISLVVAFFYTSLVVISIICLASLGKMNQSENYMVMLVYCAFSGYWVGQVIVNVIHTTVAGVFATYYFTNGTGQLSKNPTGESLKRALCYSFGSICLGSLIVATIRVIRFIVKISTDRDSLAGAIADCIVSVIERIFTYFNRYAYTHIAIYGKPYMQAAQDTWGLVKSRGLDAVINDSLTDTTTGMIALGIAFLASLLSYSLSCLVYDLPSKECYYIAILIGVLAATVANVSLNVIDSGSMATFVCLAEDPAALQRSNPRLYNSVIESYSISLV